MIPVMMRMWRPHGAAGPTGTHLFYFDLEADNETTVANFVDYFGNATEDVTVNTSIGYKVSKTDPFYGDGSLVAHTDDNFTRYFIFHSHEEFDSWKDEFTWEGFAKIDNGITDEYSNTQMWIMGFGTANFAQDPYLSVLFRTAAQGNEMAFAVTGVALYLAPTFTRPVATDTFHWAISRDSTGLYFALDGVVEKYAGTFTFDTWSTLNTDLYLIGNRNNINFTSTTAPQLQDNIRITHGVARYTDTTNGYTVPGATYTD
jgi:hypothetical protein